MGQTWYLAIDMQLFIISPIFVYLLWRSPFSGLICLILTNIVSITANLVVVFRSFLNQQLPLPDSNKKNSFFIFSWATF